MTQKKTAFIPRGALNPVDNCDAIVPRQELDKILEHIQTSDNYIVLENPRQTGKTTLLWQIQHSLHGNGYGVVYFDFSETINHNEAEFYHHLCEAIKSNLTKLMEVPLDATLEPTTVY